MFYFFDQLGSTIDEARGAEYVHGDVVVAERQTAGRGQRGRRWSGGPGALTFSVVIDSSFLRADGQFLLSQAVAVSLAETFAEWGLETRIKWPNDIYVADRKLVGILIDHTLGPGGMLARSGVGVGINVGQREFDPWLPNPTSMVLETGLDVDRIEVLNRFHGRLMGRLDRLKRDGVEAHEALRSEYNRRLFRLDTPSRFALPGGVSTDGPGGNPSTNPGGELGREIGGEITATLRGVGPGGELLLDTPDGPRSYLFHEISFVV